MNGSCCANEELRSGITGGRHAGGICVGQGQAGRVAFCVGGFRTFLLHAHDVASIYVTGDINATSARGVHVLDGGVEFVDGGLERLQVLVKSRRHIR